MFNLRSGLVFIVLLSLLGATFESASRTIRVDRQSAFVDGSLLANDGSAATDLYSIREQENGPNLQVPFPINFFGTVYDSLYVNENGVLSFGAPLDLTPRDPTDVFNAGVPVIAPYFADADMAATLGDPQGRANGSVRYTFTSGVNMFVELYSTYQGATSSPSPRAEMQVAFFGNLNSTDFFLELNYNDLEWESGNLDGGINGLGGIPPRIGFSDGFGRVYEVPGSGTNGALLGNFFDVDCDLHPLSVSCNNYRFQFIAGLPYINGVPIFRAQVPEPTSPVLLLTALGLLELRRRRNKL